MPILQATAAILLATALLTAAAARDPPPAPHAVGFDVLPGWEDDRPSEAWPALLSSCRALTAGAADRLIGGAALMPFASPSLAPSEEEQPSQPVTPSHPGMRAIEWARFCADATALVEQLRPPRRRRPPPPRTLAREAALREAALRAFLEDRLEPVAVGPGLLTGYYEPELRGAEFPNGPFAVPLHAMPPSPPAGHRHPDRAAIETGALDGRGLEIVWVDDAVDAFFLHIQGSGRVLLQDGRTLRLGYAGQNGHPYRGIGRPLLERGAITREGMSMQGIRAWLAIGPPGEVTALLRSNASYVFFRVLEGLRPDQGAPGALGVPLTPMRSIAVDPAWVPLGAPLFIATRDPLDGRPLRRLVLAQDVGGAIKGQGRGDLYWGWGDAAGARAGRMYDHAEVFVLLPRRPAAPPSAIARANLD